MVLLLPLAGLSAFITEQTIPNGGPLTGTLSLASAIRDMDPQSHLRLSHHHCQLQAPMLVGRSSGAGVASAMPYAMPVWTGAMKSCEVVCL
jgi:hypothetical protein